MRGEDAKTDGDVGNRKGGLMDIVVKGYRGERRRDD